MFFINFIPGFAAAASATATPQAQSMPAVFLPKSPRLLIKSNNLPTPGWYDHSQSLTSPKNQQAIAKALGWVAVKNSADLCRGYYRQPASVLRFPPQSLSNNLPIQVSSTGPTTLMQDGRTILRQNVVARQRGRITYGDRAILYRNKNTGVLQRIEVFGHVRYVERNRLLLGDYAYINLKRNYLWVRHALYHVYSTSGDGSVRNGWGSAQRIDRLPSGVLVMRRVNYTTCSPRHNVWRIHARKLRINKNKGRAVAHGVILTAKKIPVFYSPYLSFPTDNRRKTGFLFPIISSVFSKNRGTAVTVPFYWNMAPNYDMTFSPRFMTKRGVQLNNKFRYLTLDNYHQGSLYFSALPYDPRFNKQKKQLIDDYSPSAAVANEINNYNSFRGYVNYKDQGNWGRKKSWHSTLQVQHTSDPYYLQDFSGSSTGVLADQLLNQGQISYSGNMWQGSGMVMGYQTLHQVNQAPAQDQYWRLPDLELQGYLPRRMSLFDLSFNASFVHFVLPTNPFVAAAAPRAEGSRVHSRPGVLLPFYFSGFSITPQVWLDNLASVYDQGGITNSLQPTLGQHQKTVARSIPMFALDNRLYLQQDLHIGGWHGALAVSPELFYLYVPYENQYRFPLFDTENQQFSYSRLYAMNQFTGVDRMQNANQLSIGMQLQTLRATDGAPILTIGNGVIWYFSPRRVTEFPLSAGEALPLTQTEHFSPFVSELNLNLGPWVSLSGSSSWDIQQQRLDNANTGMHLTINKDDALVAGYNYVALGSQNLAGQSIDLHQAYLGANFAITQHIKGLAYGNYNFTQHYPITSYAGLEYDSCCWALRTIVSHDFNYFAPDNKPKMQTQFYVQIELTGLGSVGNRSPSSLLSTLPGYTDHFQHRLG